MVKISIRLKQIPNKGICVTTREVFRTITKDRYSNEPIKTQSEYIYMQLVRSACEAREILWELVTNFERVFFKPIMLRINEKPIFCYLSFLCLVYLSLLSCSASPGRYPESLLRLLYWRCLKNSLLRLFCLSRHHCWGCQLLPALQDVCFPSLHLPAAEHNKIRVQATEISSTIQTITRSHTEIIKNRNKKYFK